MHRVKRRTGELEGAAARLELDKQPSKMSDLSDFLTSTARFFVKCNFTKNMAFLKRAKKSVRIFLHAEGQQKLPLRMSKNLP